MSVWDGLDEADRTAFNFDPCSVDWPAYITQIHLPSIIQHALVKTTPGPSKSTDRMARMRRQVLEDLPGHHQGRFAQLCATMGGVHSLHTPQAIGSGRPSPRRRRTIPGSDASAPPTRTRSSPSSASSQDPAASTTTNASAPRDHSFRGFVMHG